MLRFFTYRLHMHVLLCVSLSFLLESSYVTKECGMCSSGDYSRHGKHSRAKRSYVCKGGGGGKAGQFYLSIYLFVLSYVHAF